MTGVKLQHYLSESGIFTVENVFMVEILDGVIHNRVPTYYKCKVGCMINGVTELNLMKLDVLSHFDVIKVCVGYSVNGEVYKDTIPFEMTDDIRPIYVDFEGWLEDISSCKDFDKLPSKAKEYISFIQMEVNVPITRVSVGPDRLQTIMR